MSKFESGERRLTVVEFLEVCDALGADAQGIIKRVERAATAEKLNASFW